MIKFPKNELRISGYASLFDKADLSGDIVRRGAFAGSLLTQAPTFPMLYGHETQTPIGVWDNVFEDRTGLFVSGRILAGSKQAKRTSRLIISGAVSGLSIGYRPRRFSPRTKGGRDLFELELWEVSVVAFPMLRAARITQIDVISIQSLTKQG